MVPIENEVGNVLSNSAQLISAIVPLAWPLLVGIVVWKLFPSIRTLIQRGEVDLEVGGMKIKIQNATENLDDSIADLQAKIIDLQEKIGHLDAPEQIKDSAVSPIPHLESKAVLWVDDNPENNAFEIERLTDWGFEVVLAKSTTEAMLKLANETFSLVLSDLGRREDGIYRSKAGMLLLRSMREAGYQQPFLAYTSDKNIEQNDAEVREAGGDGATASQVDLLSWVRKNLRAIRK